MLNNSIAGYQTEIINTEAGCGFYGISNLSSKGLNLATMKSPVVINNVEFQNLYYGVYKSAMPYAKDTVSESHFVNCDTGIRLCNNENGADIQLCSFANTQPSKQGTGIHLVASSPAISASNFTNLYQGILTEFALVSGFGIESSVIESNFYNYEMGIESRSSNHRLKANYLNRNNSGIVNHAGSNLNLSYNANNVFMNRIDNIVFYDTMPYESTIQLFNGHNDFYHLIDNDTNVSAVDFNFDGNYYGMPNASDFKIDASKNWFENEQVTFRDPTYIDYVYVDVYDPSPSMPAPPPEEERLFTALGDRMKIFFMGNDFGTQSGLLFSEDMWLDFFFEPYRKLIGQAKRGGYRVMVHSCGAIEPLIPHFIECGVDIIDPVQTTATGMDPRQLKDRYGDKLTFHGAIDTQHVLPEGSPADVAAHAEETIRTLGRNGGYIFVSCNSLQADTPVENVRMMYETAGNLRCGDSPS